MEMQSLGMLQDAVAKIGLLKVESSSDLQKDLKHAQLMISTLSHSHMEARKQSVINM